MHCVSVTMLVLKATSEKFILESIQIASGAPVLAIQVLPLRKISRKPDDESLSLHLATPNSTPIHVSP